MSTSFSPQDALIAVMIVTSAADEQVRDSELTAIDAIVRLLPVFRGYDQDRIRQVSGTVYDLLDDEDGIAAIVGLVAEALPDNLRETAYALACDVAATDGTVGSEELRFLEIVRHDLRVGRLAAAAIERGARARYQPAPAE